MNWYRQCQNCRRKINILPRHLHKLFIIHSVFSGFSSTYSWYLAVKMSDTIGGSIQKLSAQHVMSDASIGSIQKSSNIIGSTYILCTASSTWWNHRFIKFIDSLRSSALWDLRLTKEMISTFDFPYTGTIIWHRQKIALPHIVRHTLLTAIYLPASRRLISPTPAQ